MKWQLYRLEDGRRNPFWMLSRIMASSSVIDEAFFIVGFVFRYVRSAYAHVF